jgi:hypothetical protein
VSIATLDDMRVLYDGFDLCAPDISVSMTINGRAGHPGDVPQHRHRRGPVPCHNSHTASELVFSVLVRLLSGTRYQALDDAGALDAGGHIGRLAGFVQRRSLFPRLVRPVLVVVPRVLGQDPPECRSPWISR